MQETQSDVAWSLSVPERTEYTSRCCNLNENIYGDVVISLWFERQHPCIAVSIAMLSSEEIPAAALGHTLRGEEVTCGHLSRQGWMCLGEDQSLLCCSSPPGVCKGFPA